MSTTTTPPTSDVGADVFGGIFTPPAKTAEEVSTAVLQPPIDRLRQMADQADAASKRAHAKASEQLAVAHAQIRLAIGYRKAIDYLLAGLPAADETADDTADEPADVPEPS